MTPADFPLDPDAIVPFHAYRRTNAPRILELAPSLSHFYESEKVRGRDAANEDLRQEILASPTAKAARKLARRHLAMWREDWRTIRGRVFRAGLAMQAAQSPLIKAHLKQVADDALAWSSETKRLGGLPVSWMAREGLTLMNGRQTGATPRLGMLLLQDYTPSDLPARLDALFSGERPHGVAVYIGEKACDLGETWSMQCAAPLRYIGDPARRFRADECGDLLKRVNWLVVCAPSTRQEVREILRAAKAKRINVRNLTVS